MNFKRYYLNNHCYFVTSTTIDRKPLFLDKENAQLLMSCIYGFRAKGKYLLLAFVIMPTHFHALIVPKEENNISQIMHSIKRSSSRVMTNIGIKTGSIWMPSFYEHVIRNSSDFYEKYNYIHNNPVKAKLAISKESYIFSSANEKNETDMDKYWTGFTSAG